MQTLVNLFPGAIIVFATLKNDLDDKEKRLIKNFVNFNRKRWANGGEETLVIILNATELFCSVAFLSMAWEKKGSVHQKLSKTYNNISDLNTLSDATIEIYLGLQSAMKYRMAYKKD
jgi:hypothetical protein